ncbi:MAG: CpaF family protein [Rhodospirillales bacterium]|nr:MAG: CpaF family protein [Rhodospirillales bacterium]
MRADGVPLDSSDDTTGPADTSDGGYATIFPQARGDARGTLVGRVWASLFADLRQPVEEALRSGPSAGDIAYKLGELVHSYFRTRGVTLTSYELRRVVVELLDNCQRGWPTLRAGAPPAATPVAPAEPGGLVAFDGPAAAPSQPAPAWSGEPLEPPAVAVVPAIPSPLVSRAEPVSGAGDLEATPSPRAPAAEERTAAPPATPRPPPAPPIAPPPAPPESALTAPPRAPVPPPPEPPPAMPPRMAPSEPPPRPRRGATVVSVDAAMAAIAPALLARRGDAPPLPAPRRDVLVWLRGAIDAALVEAAVAVDSEDRDRLDRLAFDELFGLGPIDALWRDEAVGAVLVNGVRSVFVERRGRLEPTSAAFRDAAQLEGVLERLARRAGVAPAGPASPFIDCAQPDGARATIVVPPMSSGEPLLVLRRARDVATTLESLVAEGALSTQMATVLRVAVRSRLNVLVAGGAGTGRTAMLAALGRAAAADDRVVTVERAPSLRLDRPHVVGLLGAGGEAAFAAAVAAALRLRADHLLVDDAPAAQLAALAEAAGRGVEGIAATVDATSPRAAVAGGLGAGFDLLVQLETRRDGVRRVTHLAELAPDDSGRDLFFYEPPAAGADDRASGRFASTGLRPRFIARAARAGFEKALLDAL